MAGMRIASTVDRFMSLCRARYQGDLSVYPNEVFDYKEGYFSNSEDVLNSDDSGWMGAIARIAGTPRAIKHVFRATLEAWDGLHGEIDLTHLLMINVLRICCPECFQFIFERIGDLRGLTRKGYGDDASKKRNDMREIFLRLTSNVDWDADAAEILIGEMFPGWRSPGVSGPAAVQGFQHFEPIDYWARFLRGVSDKCSDQSVLRYFSDLMGSLEGVSEKVNLSALVFDVEFVRRFEHLLSQKIHARKALMIFIAVSRFIENIEDLAPSSKSVASFIPLWRLYIYSESLPEEEHRSQIRDLAIHWLEIDLRYSNDIYYYWRSQSSENRSGVVEWRQDAISEFQRLYADNPGKLPAILDMNFPYASYHFSVLFSQPKYGGVDFSLENWNWFFRLLLDAAIIEPQVLLPHVATFLTERIDRFSDSIEYRVLPDNLEKYWPDNSQELLDVFKLSVRADSYSEEVKNMVLAVKSYAAQ